MTRQEGLEPPTNSLEGCRSIHLSYWRLPCYWSSFRSPEYGPYRASATSPAFTNEIGAAGFEPATSCSQSRRDTGLRYAPQINGPLCYPAERRRSTGTGKSVPSHRRR